MVPPDWIYVADICPEWRPSAYPVAVHVSQSVCINAKLVTFFQICSTLTEHSFVCVCMGGGGGL